MRSFTHDLWYAVRSLARVPVYVFVAAGSLALGIGVNTGIFSLANALFLNPLPIDEVSRFLKIFTTDGSSPRVFYLSHPNWEDIRERNDVFSDMLGYAWAPVTVETETENLYLYSTLVTSNYFALLGLEPAVGRTFVAGDDRALGANAVVVLSHDCWRDRFGADPGVVGSTLRINGHPFTVVGVGPEGFQGLDALFATDMWIPESMHPQVMPDPPVDWFNTRRALFFHGVGKLEPGVTKEEARRELLALAARLEEEYPDANEGWSVEVVELERAAVSPNDRGNLLAGALTLLAVAGLVLLLACTNVSTLQMARAIRKSREGAIRLAMGARRGHLFSRFIAESLVLSTLGGGLGLLLAHWLQSLPWQFQRPAFWPSTLDLRTDAAVVAFVILISLGAGLLCGVLPALRASSPGQFRALRQHSQMVTLNPRAAFLWNLPVVVQVILSLILLVNAGLFVRSLRTAQEFEPGFDTERLVTLSFDLSLQGYDEGRGRQFLRTAVERVESLPGVEAATVAQAPPLRSTYFRRIFLVGQEGAADGSALVIPTNAVGEGYFETVGIPQARGRTFTTEDRQDTRPVAVINQTMAERYWPGTQAVGRSFRFAVDGTVVEIVGVVADAKYRDLDEPPQPYIYVPAEQAYLANTSLVVRAASEPEDVLPSVQTELEGLDPDLALFDVTTIRRRIHDALWAQRLGAAVLSMFGLLALFLAVVGIYGVMSYSLAQRVREIGVRMAFGATRRGILRLTIRRGMAPVAFGLVAGLVLAVLGTRFIRSLLFSIEPRDPVTLVASAILLGAVAMLAILALSFRATRVDPARVLGFE